MRRLSVHDIIRAWEMGEGYEAVNTALNLLSIANGESSFDELADLTIGQRDAYLLSLREQTFGESLDCFAVCPKCGEQLEFRMSVKDIRVKPEPGAVEKIHTFVTGNMELRFRLLTSRDLIETSGYKEMETARRELARRCLLGAKKNKRQIPFKKLPAKIVTALETKMAECDPQAEVILELLCPACGYEWGEVFDIATYFWNELTVEAKRLMNEVQILAEAYGWREADILSMSGGRRNYYMEIAGT